jgi:hypothetical protein
VADAACLDADEMLAVRGHRTGKIDQLQRSCGLAEIGALHAEENRRTRDGSEEKKERWNGATMEIGAPEDGILARRARPDAPGRVISSPGTWTRGHRSASKFNTGNEKGLRRTGAPRRVPGDESNQNDTVTVFEQVVPAQT